MTAFQMSVRYNFVKKVGAHCGIFLEGSKAVFI